MPFGISFNNIPGSGLTAPIFAFEVNSAGQYQATTRAILIGYKTTAGSLAANTLAPASSQGEADDLAGPGSMLREMWRVAAANAPAEPIWLLPVADPGTAKAAWTLTVSPLPSPGQGVVEICGRRIAIPVTAADTVTTVATTLAAAINAFYDTLTGAMLPVTATSALGVVTITARHAGVAPTPVGSDQPILINVPVAGNVLSGSLAVAQTVFGTGDPDISAALAVLGDDPADFVVIPFGDSTTLTAIDTTFNEVSGRWAWNRQSFGHAFIPYTNTFSGLTTFALAQDTRHLTIMPRFYASQTPDYEWVAATTARIAPWLSDITTGNVSRNQTGLVVQQIKGPLERDHFWNYSARNTLNNSGASTFTVDVAGHVMIDKIVTTQKTGASGQPDTVFRDIQRIYQASGSIKYMRAAASAEHGMKALATENPGNLAAISTPADIKATFTHARRDLALRGVLRDEGSIVVAINQDNPNRVDVALQAVTVAALDILAVNATFYQQLPAAA
jgi:phage tail sheath gpL-like